MDRAWINYLYHISGCCTAWTWEKYYRRNVWREKKRPDAIDNQHNGMGYQTKHKFTWNLHFRKHWKCTQHHFRRLFTDRKTDAAPQNPANMGFNNNCPFLWIPNNSKALLSSTICRPSNGSVYSQFWFALLFSTVQPNGANLSNGQRWFKIIDKSM